MLHMKLDLFDLLFTLRADIFLSSVCSTFYLIVPEITQPTFSFSHPPLNSFMLQNKDNIFLNRFENQLYSLKQSFSTVQTEHKVSDFLFCFSKFSRFAIKRYKFFFSNLLYSHTQGQRRSFPYSISVSSCVDYTCGWHLV